MTEQEVFGLILRIRSGGEIYFAESVEELLGDTKNGSNPMVISSGEDADDSSGKIHSIIYSPISGIPSRAHQKSTNG